MKAEVDVQELINFIKENEKRIYKFAYGYVKNEDIALDIVHEAIAKSIQKRNTLRDKRYLKTWFYKIVINESLTYIRKNKKILFFEEMTELEKYMPIDYDWSPNENIDLYDAIDKLDTKLKTIIMLKFFEGMTLEEISVITTTNLSTIKSRLYKALEILKINIEGE